MKNGNGSNGFAKKPMPVEEVEEAEREDWSPNDDQFKAFLSRDYELAKRNVRSVLRSTGKAVAMSVREMKDCLLHSIETIEDVVQSFIVAGNVSENNGRYCWVRD